MPLKIIQFTVVVFAGCVCVLYLKHAQQLKVFFTQIEFAPRTLPPSTFPSVAVAAAASVAADVAIAVIIAAFGIANFAASHRSLPLTTWKICCHCHVTHKIQHKKKFSAEKEAEKRKSDSEKKNSAGAKTSCSRAANSSSMRVGHNLIESVISINFKSLLMRIDKNTRRASFSQRHNYAKSVDSIVPTWPKIK